MPGQGRQILDHTAEALHKLETQWCRRVKLHVQEIVCKPRVQSYMLLWLPSSWTLLTLNSSCSPETQSPAARGAD